MWHHDISNQGAEFGPIVREVKIYPFLAEKVQCVPFIGQSPFTIHGLRQALSHQSQTLSTLYPTPALLDSRVVAFPARTINAVVSIVKKWGAKKIKVCSVA